MSVLFATPSKVKRLRWPTPGPAHIHGRQSQTLRQLSVRQAPLATLSRFAASPAQIEAAAEALQQPTRCKNLCARGNPHATRATAPAPPQSVITVAVHGATSAMQLKQICHWPIGFVDADIDSHTHTSKSICAGRPLARHISTECSAEAYQKPIDGR